jgi:hypothetical protein
MVAGQKIALGRTHKHQTVTVLVSKTTLTVEFGDGDTRVQTGAGRILLLLTGNAG